MPCLIVTQDVICYHWPEFKCYDSNPALAFQSLDFSRPGSIADVTCLLTVKQGLLRTRVQSCNCLFFSSQPH